MLKELSAVFTVHNYFVEKNWFGDDITEFEANMYCRGIFGISKYFCSNVPKGGNRSNFEMNLALALCHKKISKNTFCQ